MHLGQDLREIAIALVGDDDRRAGLGDQEVGAGHADVGRQEFLAQDFARFRQQRLGFGEVAVGGQMGVEFSEIRLDVVARHMDRGGDDVAWPLMTKLDDVFAQVRFDGLDALRFSSAALSAISSEIIDLPLVTLRLAPRSWQRSRNILRASSASRAQWTWPPPSDDLFLVSLQIEVEMG